MVLFKGINKGIEVSLTAAIAKIDEIAARETTAPFKSKGNWVMEVGSGYAGSRCTKCLTWKHLNQEKRCSCDDQPEKSE
jgi:hypothetical protein